jgi:hypothetical protein
MQTRRWLNPSQPQTLQIAVFLFYANAVLLALFGNLARPVGILWIIGSVAAGYGIANEAKWGYGLGLLVAFLPFLFRIVASGLNHIFSVDIVTLMFEVALVVALLHPQSREYQRIWFK